MTREDIPAVEAIFRTAFTKGRPTGDLASYIETVFFGTPHYSEEHGSVVYDDGRDGIASAILSLPMPFIANGEPVMARLLCAFMSDGTKTGALGAGWNSASPTMRPTSAPITGRPAAAARCRSRAWNGTAPSSRSPPPFSS
jgi:hypothetical protein